MAKKPQSDELSKSEVDQREKDVLNHFLSTRPTPHKPLGKNAQAKRRKREKSEK